MQLKPPQVFPDRSVEVGRGCIGQQQMARPYVPAGLGPQKSQSLPHAAAAECGLS